jgi:TfoX/Sxy family transcriptional regulator of competence genes
MAYDEHLADRVRKIFKERHTRAEEKRMMGGLCFMVKDKMTAGIVDDKLMARVGPDIYEDALKKKGCKVMDFTGKPMKGYVFVEPKGIDLEDDLEYWINLCLAYNPKAKSSKKK